MASSSESSGGSFSRRTTFARLLDDALLSERCRFLTWPRVSIRKASGVKRGAYLKHGAEVF